MGSEPDITPDDAIDLNNSARSVEYDHMASEACAFAHVLGAFRTDLLAGGFSPSDALALCQLPNENYWSQLLPAELPPIMFADEDDD